MDRTEASGALARVFELKSDFSPAAELSKWNAAPDDLEHIVAGLRKAGWDRWPVPFTNVIFFPSLLLQLAQSGPRVAYSSPCRSPLMSGAEA